MPSKVKSQEIVVCKVGRVSSIKVSDAADVVALKAEFP